MIGTKKLYRVVVQNCYDGGNRTEVHSTTVLYCGYDRLEAMRVYHSQPDYPYHGAGSYYTRVRAQSRDVSED